MTPASRSACGWGYGKALLCALAWGRMGAHGRACGRMQMHAAPCGAAPAAPCCVNRTRSLRAAHRPHHFPARGACWPVAVDVQAAGAAAGAAAGRGARAHNAAGARRAPTCGDGPVGGGAHGVQTAAVMLRSLTAGGAIRRSRGRGMDQIAEISRHCRPPGARPRLQPRLHGDGYSCSSSGAVRRRKAPTIALGGGGRNAAVLDGARAAACKGWHRPAAQQTPARKLFPRPATLPAETRILHAGCVAKSK